MNIFYGSCSRGDEMNKVKILSVASAVPQQIVTNDDLAQKIDTSHEWIFTRTGIKERRIAKDEQTSDFAAQAAMLALEKANLSAEQIDLIIVATSTPDFLMPSTACIVQQKIGAKKAAALDLIAACSGFVYGVNTGAQYIQTGMYNHVLVIGAETMSKVVDWEDRSTCVLFGDGAGAVVLTKSEDESDILSMDLGANGMLGDVLKIDPYMIMNGQEVFKFAVRIIPQSVKNLLQKANLNIEDIDHIVIHQANQRMVEPAAKRLGVSEQLFFMNVERYGNTSAASIPIALAEMDDKGLLQKGNHIIMIGFGGGLTWGSTLIRW